jgi:hypothetical protein
LWHIDPVNLLPTGTPWRMGREREAREARKNLTEGEGAADGATRDLGVRGNIRFPGLYGLGTIALPFLIFLAYLTLIDLASFRGYYLHIDDVRNWFDPPGSVFFRQYSDMNLVAMGRPLGSYVQQACWSLAPTVWGLNRIRFLGAVDVAVAGGLLFFLLKKTSVPALHAAVLTCMVISLPAFQIPCIHAAGATLSVGLVLAMSAALICQSIEQWFSPGHVLRDLCRGVAVFALLLATLLIYQSFAMVFWGALAAPLLFGPKAGTFKWKDRIGIPFLLGMAAMATCFVYLRLAPRPPIPVDAQHDPHQMVGNLGVKLAWFLTTALPIVFNLWRVKPSGVFASIAIGLAVVGSLLRWGRRLAPRDGGDRWPRIVDATFREAALAAVVVLSFSPNLASGGNFCPYRTTTGLGLTAVLVLYAAIAEVCAFIPGERFREIAVTGILAVTGFYAAIIALGNVQDYVGPDTAEYFFVKSVLAEPNFAQIRAIHYVYQEKPDPEVDEFGVTTSMSPGHGVGIVRAAMYELGMADRVATTPISSGTQPLRTGVYNTENGPVLVIDLQSLSRQLFDIR